MCRKQERPGLLPGRPRVMGSICVPECFKTRLLMRVRQRKEGQQHCGTLIGDVKRLSPQLLLHLECL